MTHVQRVSGSTSTITSKVCEKEKKMKLISPARLVHNQLYSSPLSQQLADGDSTPAKQYDGPSFIPCKCCSPLAEFMIIRCHPFYLPQEFTTILLVAVYIPPTSNNSDRNVAVCELYQAISKQTAHPTLIHHPHWRF